jgi:uncharacterized membrane protein
MAMGFTAIFNFGENSLLCVFHHLSSAVLVAVFQFCATVMVYILKICNPQSAEPHMFHGNNTVWPGNLKFNLWWVLSVLYLLCTAKEQFCKLHCIGTPIYIYTLF